MKKKVKNKRLKEIKNIVLLAVIICGIVYVIYEILLLINSPADVLLLQEGKITKEETTVGYIIREETIINQEEYSKDIEKIKVEGEKVAKGEAIFKYYTIEKDEITSRARSTRQ